MSTSHARFRRWTQASALLVALCAASVLLFGRSDTSAWDTTGAEGEHNKDSHHGGTDTDTGTGWLINKHDITSAVEGGINSDKKGCRSLLDPLIVRGNRGPTSTTMATSVTIFVDLGVNFRAENCIDFYKCDASPPGRWSYRESKWKEDHHHTTAGNATGSTIPDERTYTIRLDRGTHLTDLEINDVKINDDVNARLTAACGGTPPTTTTPDTPDPPPARCPDGLTFAERLVSELTYDSDGDGLTGLKDGDADDCSAVCPADSPPSSPERAGNTVPSDEVKDENGDWLTGDALAAAIEEWRCREPVPPKDAAPGATDIPARLTALNQPSSCPAGASATPDTAEVNVAAGGKAVLKPLASDVRPCASGRDQMNYQEPNDDTMSRCRRAWCRLMHTVTAASSAMRGTNSRDIPYLSTGAVASEARSTCCGACPCARA